MTRSFLELLEYHVELEGLFRRHQESLLLWEIDEASKWLERYIEAGERHIRDEEQLLLPVFEERCGKIEGASSEILRGEHKKIGIFLREFRKAMASMRGIGTNLSGPLISLLDREATFKNLVSHHYLREQNLFYPALDKATTEAERTDLMGRIVISHASVTAA